MYVFCMYVCMYECMYVCMYVCSLIPCSYRGTDVSQQTGYYVRTYIPAPVRAVACWCLRYVYLYEVLGMSVKAHNMRMQHTHLRRHKKTRTYTC